MLLTLASYWFSAIPLLTLHANPIVRLLGALVVLVGYVNLNRAFRHLGDHYSPLFDAHLPSALVTQGYYRRIRHPIYLFNLFVSAGLAVSSGSVIVAVNAIVGLFFVLRAISIEEAYLTRHFPDYRAYAQNSWRLIPFFY
jgi:protein-S-isoprenylcysteine O-methyltransferase Ste14